MRWTRGRKSKYVEDRRGRRISGGKVGLGGGILAVVLLLVFGKDALPFLENLQGGSSSTEQPSGPGGDDGIPAEKDPDLELKEFVSFVLDDIQGTWEKLYPREHGEPYQFARLVLFTDRVRSACGLGLAAVGPFYCPGDKRAYIDLSFYRELRDRFEAPGDFAQAYVLAHEIGHHIQNLRGTLARIHGAKQRDRAGANQLAIRVELQADCLAGIWAHHTDRRGVLEEGDIEEGLAAAAAIGDDRLQRQSGGTVSPETWTHGSSAQRVKWFTTGYKSGKVADCDTFAAR
jgi:hypothetical protein